LRITESGTYEAGITGKAAEVDMAGRFGTARERLRAADRAPGGPWQWRWRRRRRRRLVSFILWVLTILLVLLVLSVLFGGFQKGAKVGDGGLPGARGVTVTTTALAAHPGR
jgi:hypothetical protein